MDGGDKGRGGEEGGRGTIGERPNSEGKLTAGCMAHFSGDSGTVCVKIGCSELELDLAHPCYGQHVAGRHTPQPLQRSAHHHVEWTQNSSLDKEEHVWDASFGV